MAVGWSGGWRRAPRRQTPNDKEFRHWGRAERGPNGHSVTEGGSSGSPLYNSYHRVIGQLYGAYYCSNPNCTNPPNDIANYGKFGVSWDNGSEKRRRVWDWLDPDNTGALELDGLEQATNLYVTLDGPDVVYEGEINTWTANVCGGTGSYSYQWYSMFYNYPGQWFTEGNGNTHTTVVYDNEADLLTQLKVVVTSGGQEDTDILYNIVCADCNTGGEFKMQDEIADVNNPIPYAYALESNYPNPFNPSTMIQYSLPEASSVSLVIYDLRGNELTRWTNANEQAGYKRKSWNGTDANGKRVPAGIYIYQLKARSMESHQVFTQNRKMVLLK